MLRGATRTDAPAGSIEAKAIGMPMMREKKQ
jgi:16S rRNA (cytosine1402-N4)-methyltransferase